MLIYHALAHCKTALSIYLHTDINIEGDIEIYSPVLPAEDEALLLNDHIQGDHIIMHLK